MVEELAPGGYNKERALAKAANIYNILLEIFDMAKEREYPSLRSR